MNIEHEETRRDVSVKIYLDPEGMSVSDVEPAAPIRIISNDWRGGYNDVSGSQFGGVLSAEHIAIVEVDGWRALVEREHGDDTGETTGGRKWCEANGAQGYARHHGATWRGVFSALEGLDGRALARVRTATIWDDPRGRSVFYAAWDQAEMDAYAGCKNAAPAIEGMRSALEGEVYGFIVDEGGPDEDSCWGFVGAAKDCLFEAQSVADQIAHRREVAALEMVAASRLDMAPA